MKYTAQMFLGGITAIGAYHKSIMTLENYLGSTTAVGYNSRRKTAFVNVNYRSKLGVTKYCSNETLIGNNWKEQNFA